MTVSQLTGLIKRAIESGVPSTVNVIGEVSNVKRHGSGHLYLTLKDRFSELSCVMWRSDAQRLKFVLNDGMEVIATGGVEVFEKTGRYQLYIRKIEPRGVGALELAFRQLRERLAAEGLFDLERKKPVPRFPRRIVLITSPTGAAISDMIRTLTRRFPCLHILLFPVSVQGPAASGEIARAIRRVNTEHERFGGVDLIIVGRGGGSLEDLWAFNEEVVARAICESSIPIISGVGHETDVTIADLVADARAATPTAAAELAVPVRDELLATINTHGRRFARMAQRLREISRDGLNSVLRLATQRDPFLLIRRREQVLDEFASRLERALLNRLQFNRRRLAALDAIVQRIAPHRFVFRTGRALERVEHRLRLAIHLSANRCGMRLLETNSRLDRLSPVVRSIESTRRLDRAEDAVLAGIRDRLESLNQVLSVTERLLNAVSYKSVMARGYSITRLRRGSILLRSINEVRKGEHIATQLIDGKIESQIVSGSEPTLFEGP